MPSIHSFLTVAEVSALREHKIIGTVPDSRDLDILVIGHHRSLPQMFRRSHLQSKFEDEDDKYYYPSEIGFLAGVTYGGSVACEERCAEP